MTAKDERKSDKTEEPSLDAIFKELTWAGGALTRVLGLPHVVGQPLQQEFQWSTQRRLDRLYCLADESLLNIEHQSRLDDTKGLALRMAVYRLMVRTKFGGKPLRQAVIFAPTDRRHRRKVPSEIRFEDLDAGGNGIIFSVPVVDLRTVDIEHFKASGELDDLLLGVLAHGDTLPGYLDEFAERVKHLTGTSRLDAIEKLVAVLAIGDTRPTGALRKEFEMWMEEVKDRQIVKDIVEIAGRDRLKQERLEGKAEGAAEGTKRAYAGLIFESARQKGLADKEDLIEFLVENADEANLKTMVRAAEEMDDLDAFLSEHGLTRPGLGM